MGGTAVCIDVGPVRLIIDDIGLRSQGVENAFGNGKGASVSAVESHAHILERPGRDGDKVSDVAVPSRGIIYGASDVFLRRERQFLCLTVDICFNLLLDFRLHLVSGAVDDLDAVVVERIVAGGNHDAAVKILGPYHIRYAGRRRHVQQVCVRARRGQSCRQGILEHIAAPPRILSYHDAGFVLLTEIPAEIPSDLKCVFHSQYYIGFAAEAVGPKIFSHDFFLLLLSMNIMPDKGISSPLPATFLLYYYYKYFFSVTQSLLPRIFRLYWSRLYGAVPHGPVPQAGPQFQEE